MLISVDLPEPDEPTMATNSPRSMPSDTPFSRVDDVSFRAAGTRVVPGDVL